MFSITLVTFSQARICTYTLIFHYSYCLPLMSIDTAA